MFKNFYKVAVRNLVHHKGYSIISIAGLAVGMVGFILIMLWVQHELSYDRFHRYADRIYRVNKRFQMGTEVSFNPVTPYPLASTIEMQIPDVALATKFASYGGLCRYKEKTFSENDICTADTSFFKVFSFQFIAGNRHTALAEPHSMVMSKSTAHKYFGDNDPIGKTVLFNNTDQYTVAAVIEDIPDNSDLQYSIFLPISDIAGPDEVENWYSHWVFTYVLLHENIDHLETNSKLTAMIKDHIDNEIISLTLQPLTEIHLQSADGEGEGSKYVTFFSIIAIFILAIACINYMNLATARSSKRAKEVGLRKVVGANKMQIIRQFIGESILFSIIAMLIAFFLVELLFPIFNSLTGKQLTLRYTDYKLLLSLFAIVLVTGIISGVYPALFLSSFQPVRVLKGIFGRDRFGAAFRKILVTVQFSLSIMLIISTGIIYSQLKYINNKDLGYNKDNVVYLPIVKDIKNNYAAFKRELLQHNGITNVARASELPTDTWAIMRGITWEGKASDEGAAFGVAAIDADYIETAGIEMADGRPFSEKFPADSANYIFNQKAIEVMGLKDPVGKRFVLDEEDGQEGTIVGVVKNFNFLPLTYDIEPMIMLIYPGFFRKIIIRIKGENISNSIKHIEEVWKTFAPDFPCEYHFLDKRFERLYTDERRASQIFSYFGVIAILISCLGLFGLASFTAEQRTKEIGVRKTLGASVSSVILLLNKDFTKWVLISNVIAWPIAYYAMSKWLQNFAYHTKIGIEIFLLSAVIALIIAVSTVSFQSIKAAFANPVDSLRYE